MSSLIKRSENLFFTRCILYLNYVFIGAMIFAYMANYINPNRIWLFSFMGLTYPLIFILNLLFVIIWIYLRKPYFLLSAFIILIGIGNVGKYYQFNNRKDSVKNKNAVSILTFNVQNFSQAHSGIYNKDTQEKTFGFLEEQNADIVCIQEYSYTGENIYASHVQLRDRLEAENYLFESYFKPKGGRIVGMVTFSRFPVVGKGIFDLKETRKFGIYTDLKIGRDTIRLYNIHLESIRLNYDDYSYLTGNVNDKEYTANTRQIIKKLTKAYQNRAKQVDVLYTHLKKSPYPVIIAGDFNDTPISYTYHKLTTDLQDAFIEKGAGLGKTLIGKIPAFRIDYVFYDKGLTPLTYQEININLSDHYPVKSSFIIQ